jgi:hypothetical protein
MNNGVNWHTAASKPATARAVAVTELAPPMKDAGRMVFSVCGVIDTSTKRARVGSVVSCVLSITLMSLAGRL